MAEPEWPGETIRKRENDEKDKKPVINDNFWRNSENTESQSKAVFYPQEEPQP